MSNANNHLATVKHLELLARTILNKLSTLEFNGVIVGDNSLGLYIDEDGDIAQYEGVSNS